ncbi:universal stress protein [haloarchaeon 3A1-DGR]|nr:universal stress protein [haloarchaeon 3A1-DGR]
MYDDILLPTDGSDGALVAVDHAMALAERFDSTLHVLYVADARGSVGSHLGIEGGIEKVSERLQEEGKEAVDEIAEMARDASIPVETEVRTAVPHSSILEYADDHNIGIIVMGTHGRSGIERSVLGSVTERVVRQSNIPVVTVPRED